MCVKSLLLIECGMGFCDEIKGVCGYLSEYAFIFDWQTGTKSIIILCRFMQL